MKNLEKNNIFKKPEHKSESFNKRTRVITPVYKDTVWKTQLRRDINEGKIKTLEELLRYPIKEPEAITDFFRLNNQRLEEKVLNAKPVGHMRDKGKIMQHKVLVGVGNKNGLIGLGLAKDLSFNNAVKKATEKAKCNLIYLKNQNVNEQEPYFGPFTQTSCKRGATRVTVRPLTGTSLTASDRGRAYCELGNFTNILIEVGSKGRLRKGKIKCFFNYYFALHDCLKQQMILKEK